MAQALCEISLTCAELKKIAGHHRALLLVIAGSKPNTSIFNLAPSAPSRKLASDDFLNAESDKNDYDW